MKKFIIFISIVALFTNCKKEKVSYTIKGQVVLCFNGTQTPQANKTIELYQQKNGTNVNAEVLSTTTTDNNGDFTFTYTTTNLSDGLIIRESSGFGYYNLIAGVPIININDMKIYYLGRYNLVVSLNVTKPYTNNDTLYVNNLKNLTYIKKAGPFTSGRIYKEGDVGFLEDRYYGGNKQTLYCGLNSLSNFIFNKDFIIENSKLCGDTVYVSLDIK